MAFKLTNSKELAIRAFINEWAKDQTLYCNTCGNIYTPPPEGVPEEPCCENTQIGTNMQVLYWLIQENKMIRETRANQYASNKDKTMRWGLSMPPRLMHDLEEYCINSLKEPFLDTPEEMLSFAKQFPQFRTCEVI